MIEMRSAPHGNIDLPDRLTVSEVVAVRFCGGSCRILCGSLSNYRRDRVVERSMVYGTRRRTPMIVEDSAEVIFVAFLC